VARVGRYIQAVSTVRSQPKLQEAIPTIPLESDSQIFFRARCRIVDLTPGCCWKKAP